MVPKVIHSAKHLFHGLDRAACALMRCLLWVWKRACSPLLGTRCRFYPTCSEYAAEAFQIHGLLGGMMLACKRLLRCSALSRGGIDPVPSRSGGQQMEHVPAMNTTKTKP